jgi:DNA-binding GntR family transcriptional regulator
MRVVHLDDEELAEALEVRAALEGLAAGLAARRVRSGALAAAGVRELEPLAAAADADAGVLADRAFHRAAAALAGNRPCQEALGRLWDRLVVARPDRPAGGGGHGALLDAVATGDEAHAADAARRHALVATEDRR